MGSLVEHGDFVAEANVEALLGIVLAGEIRRRAEQPASQSARQPASWSQFLVVCRMACMDSLGESYVPDYSAGRSILRVVLSLAIYER